MKLADRFRRVFRRRVALWRMSQAWKRARVESSSALVCHHDRRLFFSSAFGAAIVSALQAPAFASSPSSDQTAAIAVDAPFSVAVSTIVADNSLLRAFGFVGDGGSHPLSSRFSSLKAAQTIYPHAEALTDEIDWCAIQGVIHRARIGGAGHGLRIEFPACLAVVNRPIVSDGAPIEYIGQGPDVSRILCSSSGIDLFAHGLSVVPAYGATFALRGIGLFTTGAGPRHAINVALDRNSGGFVLENVRIGSYSSAFSWGSFVNGVGCTNTRWNNVVMSGGEYNSPSEKSGGTQIACTFASNSPSDRSFVYSFVDCQIGAVHTAFRFVIGGTTPDNHGSIEGVIFTRCGGRTDTGPWFDLSHPGAAQTGWYPPYYIWDDCNMEGPGALIHADAISEFHISKNLQFCDKSQYDAPLSDYINLGRALHGTIEQNTITLLEGAAVNALVRIGTGSEGVTIRDNVFDFNQPNARLAAGIVNESGNTNIRALDNIYDGPFTDSFSHPAAWPAKVFMEVNKSGGGSGNVFTALVAGFCDANHLAEIDRQSSMIKLIGSHTGRTGHHGRLVIQLPDGLFTSIAPNLTLAQNGNGDAGQQFSVLPIPARSSIKQLEVLVIDLARGACNAAENIGIQVNYQVCGF